MSTTSTSGGPANHFAPYIQELHEFFAARGLPFGSPADLVVISRELSVSEDFRAELSSMVRSFIFREGGALTPAELLDIVAFAVTGVPLVESSKHFKQELRKLFDFFTEIVRTPRAEPPQEQVPAAQTLAVPAPSPTPSEPPRVKEPRYIPPIAEQPLPAQPVVAAAPSKPLTQTKLSQASPRTGVANAKPRNSRALWAAGAAALLIVGTSVVFLHKPARHEPSPAPIISTSQSPATQPASTVPAPVPIASVEATPLPATPPEPTQAIVTNPPTTKSQSSRASRRNAPASRPRIQAASRSASQATYSSSHTIPFEEASTGPVPTSANEKPVATSPSTESDPASAIPARPLSTSSSRSVHRSSFAVSSGVMAANLLSSTEPDYPRLASVTHVEGQVTLQAVIAKDGTVSIVHVLGGHRLLRGAAVKAVRTWRYRPYLVDGRPVDVATIITLSFQLHR